MKLHVMACMISLDVLYGDMYLYVRLEDTWIVVVCTSILM